MQFHEEIKLVPNSEKLVCLHLQVLRGCEHAQHFFELERVHRFMPRIYPRSQLCFLLKFCDMEVDALLIARLMNQCNGRECCKLSCISSRHTMDLCHSAESFMIHRAIYQGNGVMFLYLQFLSRQFIF